jgi:Holliday junction DNA helicase RuvA
VIAHLRGNIILKQPNALVVDIAGVGYEVSIPLSTFYDLGEVGSEVSLRVHTHVREDAIQLFGFRTKLEKEVFLKLTSVSGIGPRLAITILSGIPVWELVLAIQRNDLARLTGIPGVGRKTAERIVVELRDKLGALAEEREGAKTASERPAAGVDGSVSQDTIAALVALGYQKQAAERAVAAALRESDDISIESVLRRALKLITR